MIKTKEQLFNTKIFVKNRTESRLVQKHAFKLGLKWCDGTKRLYYPDVKEFYFCFTNNMSYSNSGYGEDEEKEIKFKQLLSKEDLYIIDKINNIEKL